MAIIKCVLLFLIFNFLSITLIDASCYACAGPCSPTSCYSCKSGFCMKGSRCVRNCPAGQKCVDILTGRKVCLSSLYAKSFEG